MRKGGKILKIQVNKYSLTPKWFVGGTKGSYGNEELEFCFSGDWDGLVKKVTFIPYGGDEVSIIYTEPIAIPYEVMVRGGTCVFAVSGYKDSKRLLSLTGEIKILDTVASSDNSATVPTPDEMTQVMSIANEALETARQTSDNVNAVTEKFDEIGKNAEKAIQNAEAMTADTEIKYRKILSVESNVETCYESVRDDTAAVSSERSAVEDIYNNVNKLYKKMGEIKSSADELYENVQASKDEIDGAKEDILSAKESVENEVYGFEDEMKTIFSNSLLGTLSGRSGSADDVSPVSSRFDISIKGESTQESVPTPEAHVDVVHSENPTITVCGTTVIIPLSLAGKGEYRDEVAIDRSAKTVKLIRRYCKYAFTGNEKWSILTHSASVNTTLASHNAYGSPTVKSAYSQLCNVLPNKMIYSKDEVGIYTTTPSTSSLAQIFVRIAVPSASSSDFNEVFGEGTYLWYPMKEPVETDCTDTEWGQALLALVSDGTSLNFECTADTKITYSKDINKAIEKLTEAIIALGGTI